MSREYTLKVPIYYTKHYKTKKSKNIFVALNWYRNVNHFLNDEVKKYYKNLVAEQLKYIDDDKLLQYRIKYSLYSKNKMCDLMNVISVIDKYVQDALISASLINDDNVENCKSVKCEFVEVDKDNPRIEILIQEVL